MVQSSIKIPSPATLKKYGLTEQDYRDIINRQGGVCPICKKVPTSGRFVIDHYHHSRYKHLPPELRKALVRGCLCWFDNYYSVAKGITVEKSERITKYLKDFEDRRPK